MSLGTFRDHSLQHIFTLKPKALCKAIVNDWKEHNGSKICEFDLGTIRQWHSMLCTGHCKHNNRFTEVQSGRIINKDVRTCLRIIINDMASSFNQDELLSLITASNS
jgi:hypothetical protein